GPQPRDHAAAERERAGVRAECESPERGFEEVVTQHLRHRAPGAVGDVDHGLERGAHAASSSSSGGSSGGSSSHPASSPTWLRSGAPSRTLFTPLTRARASAASNWSSRTNAVVRPTPYARSVTNRSAFPSLSCLNAFRDSFAPNRAQTSSSTRGSPSAPS